MTSRLLLSFALALTTATAITGCDNGTTEPPPGQVGAADLIGKYIQDGDCNGSPENPGCDSFLELEADGVGSYIGDDIVEDITWRLDGTVVHAVLPWGPLDLDVVDASTLIDRETEAVWEKQPER